MSFVYFLVENWFTESLFFLFSLILLFSYLTADLPDKKWVMYKWLTIKLDGQEPLQPRN